MKVNTYTLTYYYFDKCTPCYSRIFAVARSMGEAAGEAANRARIDNSNTKRSLLVEFWSNTLSVFTIKHPHRSILCVIQVEKEY